MLAGLHFYWQLATGEIIQGVGGSITIFNTKVGRVLLGPINACLQVNSVFEKVTH